MSAIVRGKPGRADKRVVRASRASARESGTYNAGKIDPGSSANKAVCPSNQYLSASSAELNGWEADALAYFDTDTGFVTPYGYGIPFYLMYTNLTYIDPTWPGYYYDALFFDLAAGLQGWSIPARYRRRCTRVVLSFGYYALWQCVQDGPTEWFTSLDDFDLKIYFSDDIADHLTYGSCRTGTPDATVSLGDIRDTLVAEGADVGYGTHTVELELDVAETIRSFDSSTCYMWTCISGDVDFDAIDPTPWYGAYADDNTVFLRLENFGLAIDY